MSLSNSEKNDIKQKAKTHLEKSIYTLSLLVGILPEEALATASKESLASTASFGVNSYGISEEEVIDSLYNFILNYRAIG